MKDLELYSGGGLVLTRSRRASKEIARARVAGSVAAARATVKVDAITDVTEAALVNAGQISALEAMLVQRTPHAQARLQFLADTGVDAMAGVIRRMERRL